MAPCTAPCEANGRTFYGSRCAGSKIAGRLRRPAVRVAYQWPGLLRASGMTRAAPSTGLPERSDRVGASRWACAAFGLADHAALHEHPRAALNRQPVERCIPAAAAIFSESTIPRRVGVDQDEVGRAAGRERAGLEPEQLRRIGARAASNSRSIGDHARRAPASATIASSVSAPGHAGRGVGERQALVLGAARIVARGDHVDRAVADRRDRRLAVGFARAAAARGGRRCGSR